MCVYFGTVSEICDENFTQSFIYTRQLGAYQKETTDTYTKLLTLLAFFRTPPAVYALVEGIKFGIL